MRPDRFRQRIQEMKGRIEDGWAFAIDRLYQESIDSYFVFEGNLEEIEQVLAQIEEELECAGADEVRIRALGGRFEFLEDHFEEVDSGARNRPKRRRRRRFSLFDFFGQNGGPEGSIPEVTSVAEAYRELGLNIGTEMRAVTTTFRRLVKELHPDARGGDRSTEARLRKIFAAYDFIKKNGGSPG